MYGFGLDTRATQYQASIADQSSRFALAVLETERDRTSMIRIWHHRVLEALAWANHPQGCECALEGLEEPSARVRAASRAIRRYMNDRTDELAVDPTHWTRQMDPRQVAELLRNSALLHVCVDEMLRDDGCDS